MIGRRLDLLAPLVFLLLVLFGIGRGNVLDRSVAVETHQYLDRRPVLVTVSKAATFLGSSPVLIGVTAVAVLVVAATGRRAVAIRFLLVAVGCDVTVGLMKVVVGRPRPVFAHPFLTAGGYAFPSGHAANSCAVYGMVLLSMLPVLRLPWQRTLTTVLLTALVLAISTSRILLGVHWLSDVMAGLALGFTAVSLGRPSDTRAGCGLDVSQPFPEHGID